MMFLWALLYYVLPDVQQTFRFITPGLGARRRAVGARVLGLLEVRLELRELRQDVRVARRRHRAPPLDVDLVARPARRARRRTRSSSTARRRGSARARSGGATSGSSRPRSRPPVGEPLPVATRRLRRRRPRRRPPVRGRSSAHRGGTRRRRGPRAPGGVSSRPGAEARARRRANPCARARASPTIARMARAKLRLGVSACLVGRKVRYDGQHKRDAFVTDVLGAVRRVGAGLPGARARAWACRASPSGSSGPSRRRGSSPSAAARTTPTRCSASPRRASGSSRRSTSPAA